jgi:[protein-PII] uridylyltransferase
MARNGGCGYDSITMASGTRISPAIFAARDKLTQGRQRLRQQHDSGSLGVQVSLQLTQLLDETLLDLYQWALTELWDEEGISLVGQVALVAHGGYGRADVAPYSDVDLMLLHGGLKEQSLTPLVRKFTNAIYDTGLQLGFTVRTIAQACEMARNDATVLTALAESRLLSGEESLFARFMERFRRESTRSYRTSIEAIERAREEERNKYGETVYLLEPNVKRSRGGLRDIQHVRWLGFARYGECDPESLHQLGHLSQADWRRLRDAREFLLRLRNELHFADGKSQDVLERSEQMRIAGLWGYQTRGGLLAVEQFMQDYFRHTENVRDAATHFLENVRPGSPVKAILEPLLSHRADQDFRVGPSSIRASSRGAARLRGNLAEVLRLMVLSALYDKPIAHDTWEAVRTEMDRRSEEPEAPLSAEARGLFLDLLAQPAQLGPLLRRLHRLRVLEQIIPDMQHARCLLQFNSYHKFTVDEHSLRAVEAVTDLVTEKGPLGDAYRAVKNKRVLHLAALLHDLGKGYEEDHSEVGRRIALETAQRLELPPDEAEALAFLVHKHLRMSNIAQQHDIHDDRVVVPFAAEVGSPELLRKLYVLTCADISAVGPGTLNAWRRQLLTDLFFHTLELISSGSPEETADLRVREKRQAVTALVQSRPDAAWWRRQVEILPAGILFSTEPARIVSELSRLQELPRQDAIAWGRYVPQRKAVEYAVGTHEEITPGIFYKLTGALSSRGQRILSAEIHTLADGLVLDHFYVEDRDFDGPPPQERIDEICGALICALKDSSEKPPEFRRTWQAQQRETTATLNRVPTQVRIDNATSDRATVVAVFTYDRMGLLYSIAKSLFDLGLSVTRAKIGTRLDQVVDVFYVTDSSTGAKLPDGPRLEEIRSRLLQDLEPAIEFAASI